MIQVYYPEYFFALCLGLAEEEFDFGLPPGRIPFMPGREPEFPEPRVSFVGPGCPQILARMAFVQQDSLGQILLAQAGIPVPTASKPITFGWSGGLIIQMKFLEPDLVFARRCNLGLSEAEGREVVGVWDSLSFDELQANGFT